MSVPHQLAVPPLIVLRIQVDTDVRAASGTLCTFSLVVQLRKGFRVKGVVRGEVEHRHRVTHAGFGQRELLCLARLWVAWVAPEVE